MDIIKNEIIEGEIDFFELCDLFNFSKKDFYRLEDSLSDYIYDSFHYCYKEVEKIARKNDIHFDDECEDIARDIYYNNINYNINYNTNLYYETLNLIEEQIDQYIKYISNNFKIVFFINKENYEKINIKIEGEIDEVLRKGMNAYGLFDYDAHSDKDKESLKKPYYIIRELLNYYEACESKPSINFKYLDFDKLFKPIYDQELYSKLIESTNSKGVEND